MSTRPSPAAPPAAHLSEAGGQTRLLCSGAWTIEQLAALEPILQALPSSQSPLTVDASALSGLDTAGAWLLQRTAQRLGGATIEGLQPAQQALLDMIDAQQARPGIHDAQTLNWLQRIGARGLNSFAQARDMLAFVGETALAFLQLLRQPRRLRGHALMQVLQTSGLNALPIVGLLAFLMGVVIAYQGAEQLERYGANIFIADLVGLSMLRELAPLLTAIIIAGRSGSAYTAEIGTMQVTEEVDALRAIGISPMDYLVLPKLIGLMIALPLLSVYADIMGIFGGMVIAASQLDVSYYDFIERLGEAVSLSSYLVGIGKAPVFAALIATVGCFQGFRVTGSADSVGRQTTVSVVQSIFLVIIADALFSIAFSELDL